MCDCSYSDSVHNDLNRKRPLYFINYYYYFYVEKEEIAVGDKKTVAMFLSMEILISQHLDNQKHKKMIPS